MLDEIKKHFEIYDVALMCDAHLADNNAEALLNKEQQQEFTCDLV